MKGEKERRRAANIHRHACMRCRPASVGACGVLVFDVGELTRQQAPYGPCKVQAVRRTRSPGKGPSDALLGARKGGNVTVTQEFLPLSFLRRGSDRNEGPGGLKKIPYGRQKHYRRLACGWR